MEPEFPMDVRDFSKYVGSDLICLPAEAMVSGWDEDEVGRFEVVRFALLDPAAKSGYLDRADEKCRGRLPGWVHRGETRICWCVIDGCDVPGQQTANVSRHEIQTTMAVDGVEFKATGWMDGNVVYHTKRWTLYHDPISNDWWCTRNGGYTCEYDNISNGDTCETPQEAIATCVASIRDFLKDSRPKDAARIWPAT